MNASLKKIILIVLASIAGLLLLAVLGWFLYLNTQFSVYQDDQYKFTIKYPKAWQVILHPRADVAVAFMRPKDTALDALQENFNVTVQAVPMAILSLDAFSARVKAQMTGVFGKSINIVEDKSIQFGWRPGHIIVLEAPTPDHLKMVNAWVMRGSQVYILTFLGNMDKYTQDSPLVNAMVHSFQLQ